MKAMWRPTISQQVINFGNLSGQDIQIRTRVAHSLIFLMATDYLFQKVTALDQQFFQLRTREAIGASSQSGSSQTF